MQAHSKIIHDIRLVVWVALLLVTLYGVWQVVTAKTSEPIRIGILHSLTGVLGIDGSKILRATLLAVEEINAQGGILGKPLVPIVADGKSDMQTFAQEAERLITKEKVQCLFGCYGPPGRKGVLPVVERHKVLLFYPFNYEGLEFSEHIIYSAGTWNQRLLPSIVWAMQKFGKRIFLISTKAQYSYMSSAIVKEIATQLGAEIVGDEHVAYDEDIMAPYIDKIAAAKPDFISSNIFGKSNGAFYTALRKSEAQTKHKIPVMSGSISDPEIPSIGIENVVGVYTSWPYYESVPDDENKKFKAAFARAYGSANSISDLMEAGYLSVYLWAAAVQASKDISTNAVLATLPNIVIKGPEGYVQIQQNRHAARKVRIAQISKTGKNEVIWESRAAQPPHPFPSALFIAKAGMIKTQSDAQWNKFANRFVGNESEPG